MTPHPGPGANEGRTNGLAVTPGFFQHRMDLTEVLLKKFLWHFVLVYIGDIVIFSRSPEEHLKHVDQVLDKLQASGVSLSIKKRHFGYPSLALLGHDVSRLGYTTGAQKREAMLEIVSRQDTLSTANALRQIRLPSPRHVRLRRKHTYYHPVEFMTNSAPLDGEVTLHPTPSDCFAFAQRLLGTKFI